MTYDFDIVVLGGGPGGYEAAIRCTQLGRKTCLIEAREMGGTCLNRGCIPTKALLHGAEVYESVLSGGTFGIHAENVSIDYAKLVEFKNARVARLRSGIGGEGLVDGLGRQRVAALQGLDPIGRESGLPRRGFGFTQRSTAGGQVRLQRAG